MKKLLCLALAACLCLALAAGAVAEDNWKIAILTGHHLAGRGGIPRRRACRCHLWRGSHHYRYVSGQLHGRDGDHHLQDGRLRFRPGCQGHRHVPGCAGAKAGFDRIREMGRDDILLIAGVPQEDPDVITEGADFVLYTDEAKQGRYHHGDLRRVGH